MNHISIARCSRGGSGRSRQDLWHGVRRDMYIKITIEVINERCGYEEKK